MAAREELERAYALLGQFVARSPFYQDTGTYWCFYCGQGYATDPDLGDDDPIHDDDCLWVYARALVEEG